MADDRRIYLGWPIITEEMKKEVIRVLTEEKLVLGESVFKFEEEFARYIGVDHAISTSSGTDALILVLRAMDLTGQVLTSAHSFIATANAIKLNNLEPIFSDIDLTTGNIDPKGIQSNLSDNVSAILPVHLHGFPVDMEAIKEKVPENVPIIEDAAQAHGATYKSFKVGQLGIAAAFSFYSTKNMTVGGDGGMVTTDDDKIAETITKIRNAGRIIGKKYEHDVIGVTSRLNTVNAAIGRLQLEMIDEWIDRRREIAQFYSDSLCHLETIHIPKPLKYSKPVYHLYPILIKNPDVFVTQMKERGIECGRNYPLSIPEQPLYRKNNPKGKWANASKWASKVVCLPMHANLSDADVKYVIDHSTSLLE